MASKKTKPTPVKKSSHKRKGQVASDTRLVYNVTPNSIYYTRDAANPSIVALTISAVNNSGQDVTLSSIEVEIIISGTKEQILTEKPDRIDPVSSQPDTWKFVKNDPGVFIATPLPGVTVPDKTAIQFRLENVIVNETGGTTFVSIYEITRTGENLVTFNIDKIRSSLNVDVFDSNPVMVAPGGTTTLRWETTAAATVTLFPGNFPDLKTSDSVDVVINETTNYTLTAYGAGPGVSKQWTVSVAPVRIKKFDASVLTVNANEKVTLTWETENASRCEINPGFPLVELNGTVDVYPSIDTTYTLTAYSLSGKTENKSLTVIVNPVTINSFTASPAYGVMLGNPVSLSWNVVSSTGRSITPNVGQVGATGTKLVIPGAKTTYTLTAQGKNGPQTQSVTVLPMIESWQLPTTQAAWNDLQKPVLLMAENKLWMMAYGNSKLVSFSDDGSYWEPAGLAAWSERGFAGGAVLDNKLWLMGGQDYKNKTFLNDVWYSEDGGSWYCAKPSADWTARANFGCVAFDNKLWVMGGNDAAGNYLNDVWNSSDGITWNRVTANAGWSPRSCFSLVVFDQKMYVVCGKTSATAASSELWYSTNGSQWALVNGKPSPRYNPNVCAIENKLYIAGGTRPNGDPIGDLNYMTTDFNWTVGRGIIADPPPQDCGCVQYQNALWLVGGLSKIAGGSRINKSVYYYFPAPKTAEGETAKIVTH